MNKLYFLLALLVVARGLALDVKYAPGGATLRAGSENISLRSIGEGLRWKPVSFLGIRVDVYRASSFVDVGATLQTARAKIMRLTFLRDLDASKIRESMETALRVNDVDPEKGAVGKLFAQFQFAIKEGEVMSIIGLKKSDGNEVVEIQTPAKTLSAEGPTLATDLWKGWYGKPADSGIEALQKSLLSNP